MFSIQAYGQVQKEYIKRGMLAVKTSANQVLTSWRFLETDEDTLAFNVYRITDGADAVKVNPDLLRKGTNFIDRSVNTSLTNSYFVTALKSGGEEVVSDTVSVWAQNYLSVPLQIPAGGTNASGSYTYTANDASVGDLDGDGEYEIVLKWDPTDAQDNANSGYTGNVYLDGYEMDGTRRWRIDLGVNIRAGAHYTQFMVYDLDGDSIAEIVCKTAPGTKDGSGNYLSLGPAASDDDSQDYRNSSGRILSGPEYLTVFDGSNGHEKTTVYYIPRRHPSTENPTGSQLDQVWGDDYGNRVDRFLACIAYLDGMKPSVVMCRGYYTRTVLAAWDWNGDTLINRWTFDSNEGYPTYAGQGNHNLSVGDVDNDGKDEIMYGACAIDDDGTGLYTTGWGHGDAIHFGDLDPTRPGLELFEPHEHYPIAAGVEFRDAATGELIWGYPNPAVKGDVGRGMSADIDPNYVGSESWASQGLKIYNAKGQQYSTYAPGSINFGIWWDGDLLRELFDATSIRKWDYVNEVENDIYVATDCASNNDTKKTPCLQADLFGDWREELILRKSDNTELRIFTTTDSTKYRINCLMQDHIYRMGIAWQNVAYNQPPHTGFYLGYESFLNKIIGITAKGSDTTVTLSWVPSYVPNLAGYNIYRSENSEGPFDTLTLSALVDTSYYQDKDGLINDSVYYYIITAVDSNGVESENSDVIIGIPTLRPDQPEGLLVSKGNNKALVGWNSHADVNVTGYNVYRKETIGGDYTMLNSSLIADTMFIDSTVTNGNTYYYAVSCVNNADKESFLTEGLSVIPAMLPYIIQAEDCSYEGISMDTDHTGYTGTAFANFNPTGFLRIPYLYTEGDGSTIMVIRYALGNTNRTGVLEVNDSIMPLTMYTTANWDTWVTDSFNLQLNPGFMNFIRIEATGNDFGNLDQILFKPGSFVSVNNTIAANNGLLRIAPNPFRNSTEISFMIESESHVTVKIYSYLGQEVKQLFDGNCITGRKELIWNGNDGSGNKVSRGIYFCNVMVNNQEQWIGKIICIE
ncbi:MAG: hypothetical protein JXB49_24830 [Bacteroidales bacterium]|nr:hypothetical protein [Bacteroidales bacterium]